MVMSMKEFDRLKILVKDKFKNIESLRVLVLGVGGVGGYVVESLVRCGISKIILVDYDTVDETNINRQIIATHKTIGLPKVDVFENRIKEISPNCEVIKIKEKITVENIDLLFQDEVDFYVDACDTISVKQEFLKCCLENKKKFIMSMGTANKICPEKLEIIDLSKTSYDPIAKILRKYMKDKKLKGRVPVVASKEEPIKAEGRLGSVSFVPSTAGLLITSYIIREVLHETDSNADF